MYGYLTRQKIVDTLARMTANYGGSAVENSFYANDILNASKLDKQLYDRYGFALQNEKYIVNKRAGGSIATSLTLDGLAAAATQSFKYQNQKMIWGFVKDFTVIAINIIIAWAAIKALNKDNSVKDEVKDLREQQKILLSKQKQDSIRLDTLNYLMQNQKPILPDSTNPLVCDSCR